VANPEHVEIVRQGKDAIEKWRAENPDVRLELSGASLSIEEYHQAFLVDVDLMGVTLSDTDIPVDFFYGKDGVVQELKNKVDSQLDQGKNSVKLLEIFFRFLNWAVLKLLGTELVTSGDKLKSSIEQWQRKERELFPASESIDALIAGLVRFIRVGIITLLFVLIPYLIQLCQVTVMMQQNSKIQSQIDQQAAEIKRANRILLIDVLYQEKDVEKGLFETLFSFAPNEEKEKIPKANLRVRQEAFYDLIKMERDADRNIYFNFAILSGLNLSEVHLEEIGFRYTHFERANLSFANLTGADLTGAYLEGANLEGITLIGADLTGAHLEGTNLEGITLIGADLTGAHLEGANLEGITLNGADLTGAHLERAYLRNITFEGADLTGAHLEGADLENVDLEGAIVDASQWIENLQKLVPPVKGFDFSYWSVAEREVREPKESHKFIGYKPPETLRIDENGDRFELLNFIVGPAEAKKRRL